MIIDAHAHIFSSLSGFGADGELRPLKNGKAIWSTGEVIQLIPEEYGKTEFPVSSLLKLMDDVSGSRTIYAVLPREVFNEHILLNLYGHLLLPTLIAFDVVAGRKSPCCYGEQYSQIFHSSEKERGVRS